MYNDVVDLRDFSFAGHVDLNLYAGPHALMTDMEGKIWVTVDANRCVLVIDPEDKIERRQITTGRHIGGELVVTDGTDGYTLWGGYWNQAYYPSRLNSYMPAQHSH